MAATPVASWAGRTWGWVARIDARVRVHWPDGETGPWLDVAANQFVDIARDATQAVPWTPPAAGGGS